MYENFGNFLLIIFTIKKSSFTIKKPIVGRIRESRVRRRFRESRVRRRQPATFPREPTEQGKHCNDLQQRAFGLAGRPALRRVAGFSLRRGVTAASYGASQSLRSYGTEGIVVSLEIPGLFLDLFPDFPWICFRTFPGFFTIFLKFFNYFFTIKSIFYKNIRKSGNLE